MRGRGWSGRGRMGGGRGNPYPYCRFYPWLPRRWWASPYVGRYTSYAPYSGYRYPGYGALYPGYMPV